MRVLIVSSDGLVVDHLRRSLLTAGVTHFHWLHLAEIRTGLPSFEEGGIDRITEIVRVFVLIDATLCAFARGGPNGGPFGLAAVLEVLKVPCAPVRGLVMEDCLHDFIPALRAIPKVDVLPTDTEAERCTAAALELMPGFDQVEEITVKLRGLPFRGWIDTLMAVLEPEEFIATVAAHSTDAAQLRVAVRHLWAAGKLTLLRSSLDMPPLPCGAGKL